MDRYTYWLLDAVVRECQPLRIIAREESVGNLLNMPWQSVGNLLNMPWHGMDKEQLLQTLERSFTGGDLMALVIKDDVRGDTFVPTERQVRAALDGQAEFYYGLTPQGGSRWEESSAPHWEKLVDYYCNLKEGEISATTEGLAQRYLASQPYFGVRVIAGSEEWREVAPWHVTYWKSLPKGYSVSFQCEEQLPPQPEPAWVQELVEETTRWYTNLWY